jgi:hypothetical protein
MPNRDERCERVVKNRGVGWRLFLALVLIASTMLTSVPVTKAQQGEDGSILTMAFQNLEPTDEALVSTGVAIARLDTRKVSVKGLAPGVYDLVLQDDGKGGFRVHAVEVGTGQVYQDIATPALVDSPTGKALNVALAGDAGGEDLRAGPRICVTASVTIRIYGYPVTVSVTVCFNIS